MGELLYSNYCIDSFTDRSIYNQFFTSDYNHKVFVHVQVCIAAHKCALSWLLVFLGCQSGIQIGFVVLIRIVIKRNVYALLEILFN